jgi:hypothetical protein
VCNRCIGAGGYVVTPPHQSWTTTLAPANILVVFWAFVCLSPVALWEKTT